MLKLTNLQEALKFAGFIEEGLRYVDSWIPTMINSGGCGVFAMYLSEKLKEVYIDHKIYALYAQDLDGHSGRNGLLNFLKTGRDPQEAGEDHIIIKIGDIYLDSTGIINHQVSEATDLIEITYSQLKVLVEKGEWTPIYDHDCDSMIKSKLDEMFSKWDEYKVGSTFHFPKRGEIVLTQHTTMWERKLERQMMIGGLSSLFLR